MKKMGVMTLVICMVFTFASCAAKKQKAVMEEMKQPVNCATAEGDIRMLEHERTHLAQQIAEGVTSIFPAGLVLGVVTGVESTKMKVAVGKYNHMIDKRIAEIKSECGL